MSSYLGRLSLCCLPNRTESSTSRENGLDGIRTGICDLDRVLCSRYTTSPVVSLRNDGGHSKTVDHNFSRRVSNRDKCILNLGKESGTRFIVSLPVPSLGCLHFLPCLW